MKTLLTYIVLAVLFFTLSSCDYENIRAAGDITSREVQFSDYHGLRVSDAFNAYVTFSDTEEKIEIEANDNLHDEIIVRKDGNDLIVKMRNHTNIRGKATLNVYITTKHLTYFDFSGASKLTLENPLVAESATLELSGASELYGELYLDRLELDAAGASSMDIFGNIGELEASLSGSSQLKDYDLTVNNLDLYLTGASDAHLTVTEGIEVRAAGASTLNYKGQAQIHSKNLSGASKLHKRD